MGLGESTIRSWDEMKSTFLKKYHEYCRSNDFHNDIFKMQQQEYENLEDYVEHFLYNLQKSRHNALNASTIKTIFLKSILEENIDVLNLMAIGDVSQKSFNDIVNLCMKYSRRKVKIEKRIRSNRATS